MGLHMELHVGLHMELHVELHIGRLHCPLAVIYELAVVKIQAWILSHPSLPCFLRE